MRCHKCELHSLYFNGKIWKCSNPNCDGDEE